MFIRMFSNMSYISGQLSDYVTDNRFQYEGDGNNNENRNRDKWIGRAGEKEG